jgi:hypothetical protein
MPSPKTKNPELIGDHHPITKWQINRIMSNCHYQECTKSEWVQWATGDEKRTSLRSINQAQAKKIILAQTGGEIITNPQENWGTFDFKNGQHQYIMSILRTANIVVSNPKHGEVADMLGWFNRFLKTPKAPVNKPLMKMSKIETSKTIKALEGVAIWKNQI